MAKRQSPQEGLKSPRTEASGAPEVLTLRELLDRALRGPWRDVKSFSTLSSNVKFLNERLGDHLIPSISAEVLENFVAWMFEQGYAPATVKRRLDTLGRALSYAVKLGWLDRKPSFPEVKVRNLQDRVLSREEEEKVYAAIRMRKLQEPYRPWAEFEDLVTVLLQTGARLGEVLGIRLDDLSQQGDKLYLTFNRYETKNDKPRTIPLTSYAQAAIQRNKGASCANGQCATLSIWHFTPVKAWFFWSIIRKDVGGLDNVDLHTLRHTALTRLAQGGMDLMRLQKWAGHSDPRITAERYTHLQPSDLDGGLAILERNTI